jgi:hypothetical protein
MKSLNSNFGTDTIRLYALPSELDFEPSFDASIPNNVANATGEFEYETVLCHTMDGKPVTGKHIEILTPDYQFRVTGREGRAAASLQFSAGAYRESNLEPSTLEHVMDTMGTMERQLAERGIDWDLKAAMVVGLAANRNPIMDEPIKNYLPTLSALNVRRAVKRTQYPTGQGTGNGQWDAIFYAKKAEMEKKKMDASKCHPNLFRGEIEWKKSRVLFKAIGIKLVSDIPENWGNIEPAFNHVMQKEIFKPRNDAQCQKAAFDLSAMLAAAADKPRPFAAFTHEFGLLSLIENEGLERAKWLISQELGDTTTKSGRVVCDRWFKELEDAAARLELHKVAASGVSNIELYKELKAKMTE